LYNELKFGTCLLNLGMAMAGLKWNW